MKIKYFFIIAFYNLFNIALTNNVIIKWLTNDLLKDNVKLTRSFPPNTKFQCEWWKLIENKKILETGEEFIYGDTRKDCSLIITEFDFKKDHLDIYKPIDKMSRNIEATPDEPIFVIAYLKSFKLLKNKKSGSIYEYSCQAKFLFPNYADSLAEDIIKSLNDILKIEGKEVSNSKENNNQKGSLVNSFINNIKDLFKTKPKRDIGSNEITLNSDKVDVFVNGNNPNTFECLIEMIDQLNKSVVYSNTTIDVLNFNETFRSSANFLNSNYFLILFFLYYSCLYF